MGKPTVSMAMFNSYVKLPEGSRGYVQYSDLFSRLELALDHAVDTSIYNKKNDLSHQPSQQQVLWQTNRH